MLAKQCHVLHVSFIILSFVILHETIHKINRILRTSWMSFLNSLCIFHCSLIYKSLGFSAWSWGKKSWLHFFPLLSFSIFYICFGYFSQLSVELLSSCLHIQVVSVAEYHRRIDALNTEELRTLCRRLQVPPSVV